MNWVMFILIFGSLLCRRTVKKETSKNDKLRKLKENFMIALGLSVLFGMGWAVGLLASSDLPEGVRYPAEWIFTLTTAFLGVYLFVLYVIRSPEARRLWKRWFLCQRKRKRGVSFTSSTRRSRLSTISRTLSRKLRVRRDTLNDSRNTSTIQEDSHVSAVVISAPQTLHGNLQPVNLELVEKMKPEEWNYSEAFSHKSSEGGKEETLEETVDRGPSQYTTADDSVFSVAEDVIDEIDTSEWCYNMVHPSCQFHADNMSPVSDALPTETAPSLSAAEEECYIVENKQAEGTEITPL